MELVVIFFAGFIAGLIASGALFIFTNKYKGKLVVVDTEDEPNPYIFIEINHEDLEALKNENIVEFAVERRSNMDSRRKKNKLYYGNN